MIGRGQYAELRIGYQVAVHVGEYELKREEHSVMDTEEQKRKLPPWSFSGVVKKQDAFWLTRGPFELRAYIGSRIWKWQGVVPVIKNGRVSAVIHGEPER